MKATPLHETRKELALNEQKIYNTHEKKVDGINSYFRDRIVAAKEEGNKMMEQEQVEINTRIAGKSKEYEDKLKKLQSSIDNTSKVLEQEKENLKNRQEDVLKEQSVTFEKEYIDKHGKQVDISNERRRSFQRAQEGMENLANREMQQKNQINQIELHSLENKNQNKLDQDKKFFENLHLFNETKFSQQINKQRLEQDKDLKNTKNGLLRDIKILEDDHRFKFQNQVDKFQKKLLQANEDFEKKYYGIMNVYQDQLNDLTRIANSRINELKEHNIQKEAVVTSKLQDSFYQPVVISPEVKEFPDHYQVSFSIPPYEQDKIYLSAKGREMKITRSRDYKDTFEREDGSVNNYNKAESYTKSFQVEHILDAKKVHKQYQDGKIIFSVPKA